MRMIANSLVTTSLVLVSAFLVVPARADDLDATSAIDAVTVYPDGASVTRVIALDLPSGDTTLVAKDFPLALDPSSLRVEGEADAATVAPHVERVRAASGLPVCVGFGIKTPERAAAVARVADGVVVGSALVDEIAEALAVNESVTARVLSKVNSLAKAVRSARVESLTV